MLELLQLPILVAALVVMSWAIVRLSSRTNQKAASVCEIPTEVLRWHADLKRLSRELQLELDEKMSAVSALSEAYDQASERLGNLILRAAELEEEFGRKDRGQADRGRLSA
jgi:hypothetical protein